jgi:hypothetical protein
MTKPLDLDMFEQYRHTPLGQMFRQDFCGQVILHEVSREHHMDLQDSHQIHFANQTQQS